MQWKPTTKATSTNMLLSIVLFFSVVALSSATSCYNPDGTDRNKDSDVAQGTTTYVPCDQTKGFSMCCRYGANGCRVDGLCQGHAPDGSQPIWRESCSDQSWDSPYCLKLCIEGTDEKGNNRTYRRTLRLHLQRLICKKRSQAPC